MKRFIKLLSLIVISISVYWIYQKTYNSYYEIMSIGDQFSLGITSYGIKEGGYLDEMKNILLNKKNKINVNKEYNKKDQTIKNCLSIIQNTTSIKKNLYDTDLLVLSLGYNDLIYALSIEYDNQKINISTVTNEIETNYNHLIKEIRKYYKEKIIVIGYIEDERYDSNKQIGIQELNKIFKNNKETIFIDTNELLKDREKYYSNTRSYYPNKIGYKMIAEKIIQKTLENK